MFFQSGPWPVLRIVSAIVWPVGMGVLLASALFPAPAFADQRVILTLAAAEDIALRSEPGQLALEARADALQQRARQAGRLPDPALRVGIANYPLGNGDFSTEGMTQAQLAYRRAFPRRIARRLATDRYNFLADDLAAGAVGRSRDVLAMTRTGWLEYYYRERSIDILRESVPYFESLVTTTRTFYAAGRSAQYDVLQAELELQYLQDRIIEAELARAQAQAALSQWLGEDAYRPVPESLPRLPAVPPLQQLQDAMAVQPWLRAADARIAAEESAVDLAEANRKPGWTLDVGYGYREGVLANGDPRSDFISVAVTVDLPMFARDRHDRDLAAALADRSAAREGRRRILLELASQLRAEHARWLDLSRRINLYESQILGTSAASSESALLAYRSDTSNFSDVVRAALEHLDTRLEHIRLRVERAKSATALARLGGIEYER